MTTTQAPPQIPTASAGRPPTASPVSVHYIAVAILLTLMTAGWMLGEHFHFFQSKLPIPWPAVVAVDAKEYRMTSLPQRLGDYELVHAFGPKPQKAGLDDGERIMTTELRQEMGVGKGLDGERVGQRCSNWYVSRIYENAKRNPAFRYWALDVTYYTGAVDNAPHTPERCVAVSGAQVEGSTTLYMGPIVGLPEYWYARGSGRDGKNMVGVVRVTYKKDDKTHAVYYVFSVNGQPDTNLATVRITLNNPWNAYSYFSKLQFGPTVAVDGMLDQADAAAGDFLRQALPRVIETWPTVADVQRLEQTKR